MTRSYKGFIYALGAAVAFGIANPFIKIGTQIVSLFLYQAVLATVVVWAFGVFHVLTNRGASWHIRTLWREYILLGTTSGVLAGVFVYLGFYFGQSVNAVVLLRSEMFFAILFGLMIFKERIVGVQVIGVLCGFVGIVFFMTSGKFDMPVRGDMFLLLAAIANVSYPLLARRLLRYISSVQMIIIMMSLAVVVFWGGVWFHGFSGNIVKSLPYIAMHAGCIFVVGLPLYAMAIQHWDVWKVVTVAQLGSVVSGYIASVLLLHEAFGMWQWGGTACVILGMFLVLWQNDKEITNA